MTNQMEYYSTNMGGFFCPQIARGNFPKPSLFLGGPGRQKCLPTDPQDDTWALRTALNSGDTCPKLRVGRVVSLKNLSLVGGFSPTPVVSQPHLKKYDS